jgi:FMN reductase
MTREKADFVSASLTICERLGGGAPEEKRRPLVVAVGGTLRQHSSTEKALRLVLRRCAERGAETILISGRDLDLPPYSPELTERTPRAVHLVNTLGRADAIVLGSPGYHGGISGLVKNAVDYTEDLRDAALPYFDGRPVGCIATGAGWQGAVATLGALRTIVHALRGWPTPLGVAINTIEPAFTPDGECLSPELPKTLNVMAGQLLEFVAARTALRVG